MLPSPVPTGVDGDGMTSPNQPPFAPTPLHRAIDRATALKVELARLHRHEMTGMTVETFDLRRMEHLVNELADCLANVRDGERSAG